MTRTVLGIRPACWPASTSGDCAGTPSRSCWPAVGIAVGVALVFGVLVANTSLTGSAGQIANSLIGGARLQLAARSADGFDQRIATQAKQLPGVPARVPVLRANVSLVGPRGRRSVQLVGVNANIASLGGSATQNFGRGGFRLSGGLVLPASVAGEIGVQAGQRATLLAFGEAPPGTGRQSARERRCSARSVEPAGRRAVAGGPGADRSAGSRDSGRDQAATRSGCSGGRWSAPPGWWSNRRRAGRQRVAPVACGGQAE